MSRTYLHMNIKYLPQLADESWHRSLLDNGNEFTDRLFASREREATGQHEFDRMCVGFGIEYRLTKPKTPKNNAMVDRFKERISGMLDAPVHLG